MLSIHTLITTDIRKHHKYYNCTFSFILLYLFFKFPASQHNQHVNNNLTSEAITADSNNGDQVKMKDHNKLSVNATLINCLIHLLLFGVTSYITYKCFDKAVVLFSWHPTFMMVGVSIA
jgi:Ca2+/H+ antiporter